MCGRYNFTVEESEEMQEIIENLNAKAKSVFQGKTLKTGEIYPTNLAPILLEEYNKVSSAACSWGFSRFDNKGVIINARSETAFEKKTFRNSLLNYRCIIPSTGFYEWDSGKQKFIFKIEGRKALYMAGLYAYYGSEMRFVILTTDANASMKDVHTRMPLVIPKEEISTWILDYSATNDFLQRVPPKLIKEAV